MDGRGGAVVLSRGGDAAGGEVGRGMEGGGRKTQGPAV